MKVTSVEADRPRNISPEPTAKRFVKPYMRPQGPGDTLTNPKAILLLGAHKSEVYIPCELPIDLLKKSQVFVCAFNPVKPGMLATGYALVLLVIA